jgi:hypothetical protein
MKLKLLSLIGSFHPMKFFFLICFISVVLSVQQHSYEGYKLFEITLKNEKSLKQFFELFPPHKSEI